MASGTMEVEIHAAVEPRRGGGWCATVRCVSPLGLWQVDSQIFADTRDEAEVRMRGTIAAVRAKLQHDAEAARAG